MLDSLPGEVRSGEGDGRDHPGRLIDTLRSMPLPIASRNAVIDHLVRAGEAAGLFIPCPARAQHGVGTVALVELGSEYNHTQHKVHAVWFSL